jgi:hypothetical protein
MKEFQLIGVILMALSSLLALGANAVAADAPSLVDVRVVHDGGGVRLEIVLSRAVKPTIGNASGPDRLIVMLPGVALPNGEREIAVGSDGVQTIRVTQYATRPLEARVVVTLDRTSQHALKVEGAKITLVLREQPVQSGRAVPPAGKVSPLIGIFRRRQPEPASNSPEVSTASVPAQVPMASDTSAASGPATPTATTTQTASTGAVPTQVPPPTSSAETAPQVPLSFPSAVPAAPADNTADSVSAAPQPNATAMVTPTPPIPAPSQPTAAAQASASVVTQPEVAADSVTPAAKLAPAVPEAVPAPSLTLRVPDSDLRTFFKVKYVAEGAAYLDGGRSSGLSEGMKLQVLEDGSVVPGNSSAPSDKRVVADLQVISVAETSAVTEIKTPVRDVKPGDLAYLSSADQAALVEQRTLSSTRKYPQVVTFTDGDPMEDELRADVPRPPLPEVNRARGRLGLDYNGMISHDGAGMVSSGVGLVVRTDITRIGGTYWNLTGYWRGYLTHSSASTQTTIQDLINRTYTIGMIYDNPASSWVAGAGRLYLPWAPSLDAVDGGYVGRRIAPGVTAGVFGGSTPDPTSWDYVPGRRVGGSFVNFTGGSFEGFRYTSTTGAAASTVQGQFDRPFIFFDNTFSYKRVLSIYESLQADNPPGNTVTPAPGPGIARSFVTIRIQPTPRLSFDINHNYFRDVPSFDPQLVGTGLLDKYLFQGLSFGVRAEVVKHITLYTDLGRSSRSGDPSSSLNQMYGIGFDRLGRTGLRLDLHYSRFNSSFGNGSYEAVSIARNLTEKFQLQVLAGQQSFATLSAINESSKFVTSTVNVDLGARFFLNGGGTIQRGALQNYEQWFMGLGYRFDNRNHRKPQ